MERLNPNVCRSDALSQSGDVFAADDWPQDGAFLVRDCSVNTDSEPLVLVVYHEKKVYNVKIRCVANTNKYALGRSSDVSGHVQ